MSIEHKFKKLDFGKGFKTKDAILVETPYQPTVLFLGTFNPNTNDKDNMAKFYYGRNWFWPCMFNIFKENNIIYTSQRRFKNLSSIITDDAILEFCETYAITFADLIMDIKVDTDCIAKNKIIYNKKSYDLINDNDLAKLDKLKLVDWSTETLKKYLKNTPSVKTVYFTRKSVKPFINHIQCLKDTDYDRPVEFKNIFTPSGQGLKGKPRVTSLIKQWVFNPGEGYDKFQDIWFEKLDVDLNKLEANVEEYEKSYK